jgi:hypothetical protein
LFRLKNQIKFLFYILGENLYLYWFEFEKQIIEIVFELHMMVTKVDKFFKQVFILLIFYSSLSWQKWWIFVIWLTFIFYVLDSKLLFEKVKPNFANQHVLKGEDICVSLDDDKSVSVKCVKCVNLIHLTGTLWEQ